MVKEKYRKKIRNVLHIVFELENQMEMLLVELDEEDDGAKHRGDEFEVCDDVMVFDPKAPSGKKRKVEL